MKTNLTSAFRFGQLALAALTLLGSGSFAQAALTLKYTFNDIAGTTVPNTAPGATINGTLVTGAGVAPIVEDGGNVVVGGITYPLGNVVRFAPPADGNADANTPYIQTNGSLTLWGVTGSTQYTAMAWVKFNNQTGDNMVFGDLAGNRLHLGARDSRYWSGHWGDDVEGISVGGTNTPTTPGTWHHLAWTNDASNNQTIYLDGVASTGNAGTGRSGGGIGGLENGDNLVIGTSGNGGSLNGSVDDLKVFSHLLTPAQIQTEMTSTLIVPNPDIIIVSGTGSTAGNDFSATIVLKDGLDPGKQVVVANITSVTFDGAAAASFSANKVGDLTTVVAQLTSPYIPGQHVYSVHVIGTDAGASAYDLAQNVTGPIFPPVASLAAPFSATSGLPWGVREYSTTAANGGAAVAIVLGNVAPFTDHETAVVNFVDPQAAGDGGDFNNNVPFPGNTAADDNHVVVAKSVITIAAAGTQSFNLRTDDGCALKINGATCTAAFGAALDPSDSSMVLSTAVTSARVTYSFPAAGTYDVAFMSFDSGGGGSMEISSAEGAVTSGDERQLPWALLGNPAHASVPPTTSQWLTNFPGVAGTAGMWGIRSYPTEGYENVESLVAANNFLSRPEVLSWTGARPGVFSTASGWNIAGYPSLMTDTLTTPDFPMPATPGTATLTVRHRYNFEDDGTQWDGGAIFYSVNGGAFTYLPAGAFTQSGYTATIDGTGPLLGQMGFTGTSGTIVTSVATIPGLNPADELSIQFYGTWDESFAAAAPNWEIASIKVAWGAATPYLTNFAASDGGLVSSGPTSLWTYGAGSTTTRTGVVDTLAPELNFSDPQTNLPPLGVVLHTQPFPGDTPADDNHWVTVAHCRISVDTSSEYTFNNRGDDGFLLRIRAVTGPNPFFRRVTGGGSRTMSAPNEMYFPVGTGDTDTRGIIYLAAGAYDLDYVTWEGVGGFWYQLTMAMGAFIDNAGVNGTDNWVPVGHTATNTVQTQPSMEGLGWDVISSLPGALPTVPEPRLVNVDAAIAGQPVVNYPVVNFTDPQTNGTGPGRFFPDDNWTNNTGADDNYYAIRASGYLHIEQTGLYLLGFDGDDGSDIIIQGAPPGGFSLIVENATGQAVIEDYAPGTRNRLKTDVPTGQSRTTAIIYLVGPSDYPVTVSFFEIGGGSWLEVYGTALSDSALTLNKALSSLTLLRSDPSYPAGIPTITPDTLSGFTLFAQPAADLSLALVSFSFGAGDSFSVTFPSSPGLSYQLEYSTDMTTWYKAGAVYGGPGTSSTIAGNLTELSPPLPSDAARVFWRVVGLY